MSAGSKAFEQIVAPLQAEFQAIETDTIDQHKQLWVHVFTQLGYDRDEIMTMMIEGDNYEI